jgi:putative ABC transport system permease protein
VFGIVVIEAVAIAVLGMLLAFPFYAGVTAAAAAAVRATTGVVLNPFAWNAVMAWAPLGLIALSGLAGLVPAWKAYRTDVADHLAPAD